MKKKFDNSNSLCGTLFPPSSTWSPPEDFPNLSGLRRIGLDIESKDPDLHSRGPGFIRGDASVVGVSLAHENMSWYFPFGHLGGGNLDRDTVVRYLKDLLSDPNMEIVGANVQYDLEGLGVNMGVEVKAKALDVQILEPLLDEEMDEGYSLDALCLKYLGRQKDEKLLKEAASAYGIDPKSGLWKLHAKYVGPYASFDAVAALKVYDRQIEKIREESLDEIASLEHRLLPVLHRMRLRGIPIDLEGASKLSAKILLEEDALRLRLIEVAGQDVDVWSGPQLARLCEKRGIRHPVTAKGNPSFEADWLDEFSDPAIQLVGEIRELNRLRSTFIDGWIFKNHIKGRIHPQWKQLAQDDGGTRTGRMAASNPNPQQIPAGKYRKTGKENPWGKALRSLFISDTGKWCKQDYSQQEPRILTHFAELCGMTGAKLAAMAYRENPKMDFYNFMMEAAGIDRRPAKDMYLGRIYGMGKNKMAQKLGKTVDEAVQILQNFDMKVPFVKEMADRCSELAQQRGYIKTLCGRRRHFNFWEPADAFNLREQGKDTRPRRLKEAQEKWPSSRLLRANTRKALNALVQGSAADMMKMGLVQGFEREGRVPYITVHDEVGGPVTGEADAKKWQEIMEHCVELTVPVRVDMKVGKSWL